jgi:hypothetical protein
MIQVTTSACLGCGDTSVFAMTEEQLARYRAGEHVQRIFPGWSPEDRERLISGTCPSCWEEMWDEEDDWDEFDDVLEPESNFPEYEPDWYVD